ncbi:MAG: hypothetical protein N2513_08775 [Deltaproteobacteria bacterium]|nr:hypothetical protein [Deltaproteobacteria bacterium]
MKNLVILTIILFQTYAGFSSSKDAEVQEPVMGLIVERATESGISTCRFCANVLRTGRIHSDGTHIIENHIRNYLFSKKIVPQECDLNVDRCIYVLLYAFEEKVGGNLSVEKPAKVGFHIHLLDRMVPVSSFTFHEEQKPLFSNLLGIGKFFKRKAKWIDATTLAEEGVKKALDTIIGGQ